MLPFRTLRNPRTSRSRGPSAEAEGYREARLRRASHRLVSPLYLDLGGDHRDTVFVAGSGRGGTSWLSEVINHDRDYRYVFEPFNPAEVPLARPFGYRRYIRPGESHPDLWERARKVVSGGVRGPWTDRFHRRFIARKRLIKDIRANLFLGWLARSFPEMPIVFILRHPCAVALSKTRLGWSSRLEEFLEQPELVRDFLSPVVEEMRAAPTEFERHVFAWCVETLVPLTHLEPGRAHLVFYENLCETPEAELRGISDYLGSGFRDVPIEALRMPSDLARSGSAVLSGRDPARSWREELGEREIRRAVEILGYFGLDPIYGASPMPDAEAARRILERAS